jgi:sugar phosphate isomerase/epimerase
MAMSRRDFLIQGVTAITAAMLVSGNRSRLMADPLGRPVGLQLYTVMAQLQKDFDGTLAQVGAIGYKEVELAGFFGKKPAEFKKSLDSAGLHCASVHISGDGGIQEAIDYATGIGAKYVISSIILPQRVVMPPDKFNFKTFLATLSSLTLDDYKSIAERCNTMGEQAKKAGLQFGYHNHNFEFKPLPEETGYDEILKLTDPDMVKFELDCGWMVAAGHDPVAYLTKFPDRYRLLHIKDFKATATPSLALDARPVAAELGRGHIDYRPIFAAAKKSAVDWYYVEQEPPFVEMPALEAIKVDYQYLHSMN